MMNLRCNATFKSLFYSPRVIIGLNIFGFMGLIFGPILLSLFLLLMEIYNKEFGTKSIEIDANA